jgi:hypothetical protein
MASYTWIVHCDLSPILFVEVDSPSILKRSELSGYLLTVA